MGVKFKIHITGRDLLCPALVSCLCFNTTEFTNSSNFVCRKITRRNSEGWCCFQRVC